MNTNSSLNENCECVQCADQQRAHIWRLVLGLIITLTVFCLGVSIGELQGRLESYQNDSYIMDSTSGPLTF